MTTAQDIIDTMLDMANEQQRLVLMCFFKTAPGEYGHGDQFIGLKVPQTRNIVKEARLDVPMDEISILLHSPWHEVRLCGLLLLVEEMKTALPRRSRPDNEALARKRSDIAYFYLHHATLANNWDLVDLSCGPVVGEWLLYPDADGRMPSRAILDRLAASTNLWEQRIAIVSTIRLIKAGEYADTLRIATRLLTHRHDLIHKAVGWMLREVGKKDISVLRQYLSLHADAMPRTTLRYAIERMDPAERKRWMNCGQRTKEPAKSK